MGLRKALKRVIEKITCKLSRRLVGSGRGGTGRSPEGQRSVDGAWTSATVTNAITTTTASAAFNPFSFSTGGNTTLILAGFPDHRRLLSPQSGPIADILEEEVDEEEETEYFDQDDSNIEYITQCESAKEAINSEFTPSFRTASFYDNMSPMHAATPPAILKDPTGVTYAVGSCLGKGGFAICHEAERFEGKVPTGKYVALKIVKSNIEPKSLAQKFITELQIHSKLRHPNIVTFYRAFSLIDSTYVALELCPNGSLADMLKARKTLTLPEIRRIIIQTCGGVKYLHERHIVHRDLKTGNLLLDEHMNVKVGDFGLAALLVTENDLAVQRRTTMCGTPNYIAPEVLEKEKGHDERVDLWSIGIITYTLAVGKSPFHAPSKQLIYKNLMSGAYSWPDLDNEASASTDLRDLVSRMLVPEEERMNADQIVSHPFFKLSVIPESLPSTAPTVAPTWDPPTLPSATDLKRGYTPSWYAMCKASGVGEYRQGKSFQVVTGRRVRSIVHDIAQEAQLGEQPVMPIPPHKIYLSTISDWDNDLQIMPPMSHALHEIEHNAVSSQIPRVGSHDSNAVEQSAQTKAAQDAKLMPPPRLPVGNALKIDKTRRVARTISEEAAKSAALGKIAEDEPRQIGILKRHISNCHKMEPNQVPEAVAAVLQDYVNGSTTGGSASLATLTNHANSAANSIRTVPVAKPSALRDSNSALTTGTVSVAPNGSTDSATGKPSRAGSTKRAADATLARRPKQNAARPNVRIVSSNALGPMATLDELKHIVPYKKTKINNIRPEEIVIPTDEALGVRHGSTVGRNREASSTPISERPAPPRAKGHLSHVQWTRPDEVLERLSVCRANILQALARPPRAQKRTTEPPRLPFVTRWVDYSRKHGFGYVLADGTVGCVINASTKNQTPVTHVLVRNGQHHLAFLGNNFEGIEDLPLEIFEDRGDQGIFPHDTLSPDLPETGSQRIDSARRRTLAILWVKFGRYMCQSLDGDEIIDTASPATFVRFYQRVDTVGVWAFTDGALQIHFPDHTKMVVSPDGSQISMTMLTNKGCVYMARNRALQPQHLAERVVVAGSIAELLNERGKDYTTLVRPNGLRDKLLWVTILTSQWINNGGMGRLNDHDADNELILGWHGPAVRDLKKRADWVTVGRQGGD